jgi:thiol:disulfide interchange protein/DsbC/DsbD-like thiol-disulfide interchange protein
MAASRALLALLMLFLGGPALGQLPRENAIAVTLVPEARSVAPGQRVTLAFVMRPRAGWHGYWQNPGDAGIEARVAWQLPQGAAAGSLRYPVPDRLIISGLMNYVFEHDYALLSDLQVPANAAVGATLPVRARIDYLACTDEICVPESATVATELTVSSRPGEAENRALFEGFRRALPRPLGSEARFELRGGRIRIGIPLPAAVAVEEPYFFPATDGALRYSAGQRVSRNGDWLIVETEAAGQTVASLAGVLRIGEGRGLSLNARPGPVPSSGTLVGEPRETEGSAVLFALLGAVLGGLILNVMPCVFPILSLKALSLARAGEDERTARREALAYGAGAVVTCTALGGLLLALRAGGETVGWAFQLQDSRVILLLLLLVTAIALSLAGLFRLPALGAGGRLAASGGTSGAFWTGALAAFVATPCTGPFMGAALGAALVLPGAAALAVFAGLGLGLALPFLLLGFVPWLRRRLPKPGAWMARFQRILSVPMFLTAAGLAWILSRQTGTEGLLLGLGAAIVLALGLWWVGRGGGNGWMKLAPAAVAAAAALLVIPAAAPSAASSSVLGAEPFSEARLAALRQQGRPVFVYFTADWCITCKVNEGAVLNRRAVADAFRAREVAVLAGDWTSGDPAIGRFLESHGRSGVPLYLYYPPGREPQVLPQILSTERLTALAG